MAANNVINNQVLMSQLPTMDSIDWKFDVTNLDRVSFKLGYAKLPWFMPLALAAPEVKGIILSPSDFQKVKKQKGMEWTKMFARFIVAHEMGHMQQGRLHTINTHFDGILNDPLRESEADSYARLATKITQKEYDDIMCYMHDEVVVNWNAGKVELNLFDIRQEKNIRVSGCNADIHKWKNGVPDLRNQLDKLIKGLF